MLKILKGQITETMEFFNFKTLYGSITHSISAKKRKKERKKKKRNQTLYEI
jgi:hypothetical protein